MKRIFVYIGSGAGEKSHTYSYIKKILDKLVLNEKIQIQYEIYMPYNTNILGCLSCDNCFKNLYCPLDIKDDMKYIKEKLFHADVIILGSPIYLHHISSDTKRLLDRISYWTHLMKLSGKIGMAVTSNMSNGHHFGIDYLDKIMTYLGIQVIAKDNISISVPGEYGVSEIIEERTDYYAYLILSYLCNQRFPIVSDRMENFFQNMKRAMNSSKETSYNEYEYWRENELFECKTFEDVLKNIDERNKYGGN